MLQLPVLWGYTPGRHYIQLSGGLGAIEPLGPQAATFLTCLYVVIFIFTLSFSLLPLVHPGISLPNKLCALKVFVCSSALEGT